MMYTVCWTEYLRNEDSAARWARFESRREIAGFLLREGLEDDEDVLIFGREADDYLLTTEDIFATI